MQHNTTQNKVGFTLIELIIGITILALLAVGLLAALDPAEQFAKARDTSTRNTVLELHNAMIRYQAGLDVYPTAVVAVQGEDHGVGMNSTEGSLIISELTNAGELKQTFQQAAGVSLENIAVFYDDDNILSTCFRPTARSFQAAAGLMDGAVVNNVIHPSGLPTSGPDATCAPADRQGTLLRDNCIYCAR